MYKELYHSPRLSLVLQDIQIHLSKNLITSQVVEGTSFLLQGVNNMQYSILQTTGFIVPILKKQYNV